ncbi:MAG TPA: hypothetical protein VFF52_13815 [Isosphaeraceae bacterium]|nr:hypothetical protein [Isosphaeraceae bacterium]
MNMPQRVAQYERGAVSSHEMMVDSLNLVDPGEPQAVLDLLPPHLLPRLREFVETYRPGVMLSSHSGAIPTLAQVEAAKRSLDTIEREEAPHVSSAQGLPPETPVGLNAALPEDLLSRGAG